MLFIRKVSIKTILALYTEGLSQQSTHEGQNLGKDDKAVALSFTRKDIFDNLRNDLSKINPEIISDLDWDLLDSDEKKTKSFIHNMVEQRNVPRRWLLNQLEPKQIWITKEFSYENKTENTTIKSGLQI